MEQLVEAFNQLFVRPKTKPCPGTWEGESASAEAAFVEAARGAPAAFFQLRISPSGVGMPFISPDFVARYGIEQGEPEETPRGTRALPH